LREREAIPEKKLQITNYLHENVPVHKSKKTQAAVLECGF